MRKKLISLSLALVLLLSLSAPVVAEETQLPEYRKISVVNLKNFEKLVENCRLDSYSQNLLVSLETDLDLEGVAFEGIPIFCGTFEGNGHTIRGIRITGEGSDQGFFRYLTETAVVQNLHLEGAVCPEGSASGVGGMVGSNSGTIRGCSFLGTVSGKEYAGGIAGQNKVSAVIEESLVSGSVDGSHFVGGIAGRNAGVIRGCENQANVNETPQKNMVELTDITLESMINSEAAGTVTDVGGIAGTNTGLIRDSSNNATVGYPSMGYNIGGIAGTQSGTILHSDNYGEIYGRKEVGGIVGQMEPSSIVEFQEDALQVLARQLDSMGKIVSEASSNLQGTGEEILGQVNAFKYHVNNAKDAMDTLTPDLTDPELPDWDSIKAAQNNIGSSLQGMTQTAKAMNATAESSLGTVTSNLHAIQSQINAMRATISNSSESLGGTVTDLSDQDTEESFTGKVAQCKNFGQVRADLNGGGITGAMSMENDLDVREDWLVSGKNSLNFDSEIRAVILNCENDAKITVGKQNAGGIVGYQMLGLVKNSNNYGVVDGGAADYVGGISGRSSGYIRTSHANGEIRGRNYVGGIAGAASVVTDCYAVVRIQDSIEKSGAILGSLEESRTEEENPVLGNYYLPLEKDPGGIDGIGYAGQAQPVKEDAFFRLEGLPERFSKVRVTFCYSNGSQRQFAVNFGEAFPMEWVPPIPPKDGRQAYWKGLEALEQPGIFLDLVLEQGYTSQTTVLESSLLRGEIPLLFVQGIFAEDTALTVEASQQRPVLESGEILLEVWDFRTTEPEQQNQIRLQLPGSVDPDHVRVLVMEESGSWKTADHHIFGRYAVAPLSGGDCAVALVQVKPVPWWLMGGGLAGILVLAGILKLGNRKKKSGN